MAPPPPRLAEPRGAFRALAAADPPPSSGLGVSTGWDGFPTDSLVGDAMRFAEQRLQLADEIALELMRRPDLSQAPAAVQDFLLRTWPLVLAHARLTPVYATWAGFGTPPVAVQDADSLLAVVDDLLWSVEREATLRAPSRLFHLIPGLLERLRTGLALLGQPLTDYAAFFAHLERLHRPVLGLCARRRHQACEPSPPSFGTVTVLDTSALLEALQPGAWIDLYSRRQWRRARLDWADPQRRQFLFIGEHGRLHTMTRRILQQLVAARLVRLAQDPAGGNA